MMEDEGEEVGLNLDPSDVLAPSVPPPPPPLSPAPDLNLDKQGHGQGVGCFEDDIEIETDMGPTQSDETGRVCPPTCLFRAHVQLISF